MKTITIAIVMSVMFTPKSYGNELTSQELVNDILNNIKKIKQLEANLGSYRCEHTVTTSTTDNGKRTNSVLSKVEYKVARADDRLLVSIPPKNAKNGKLERPESRTVYNSGDAFAVSRDSDNQSWIIREFKRDTSMEKYLEFLGLSKTILVPLTFTGLGNSVEELVSHSKFQFTDIQEGGDGQLVTKFHVEDFGVKNIRMEGSMTFYPEMNYLLTDYDILLKFNEMQRRLELHRVIDPSSKDLHCSSLKFIGRKPHKQSQKEPKGADTTMLTISDYHDINEEEFTLDYYKVPEPTDIDALPPPFYSGWKFWAIVAAVCLIGTFTVRYLARRYATS